MLHIFYWEMIIISYKEDLYIKLSLVFNNYLFEENIISYDLYNKVHNELLRLTN